MTYISTKDEADRFRLATNDELLLLLIAVLFCKHATNKLDDRESYTTVIVV